VEIVRARSPVVDVNIVGFATQALSQFFGHRTMKRIDGHTSILPRMNATLSAIKSDTSCLHSIDRRTEKIHRGVGHISRRLARIERRLDRLKGC
jgi:hypothetical protein